MTGTPNYYTQAIQDFMVWDEILFLCFWGLTKPSLKLTGRTKRNTGVERWVSFLGRPPVLC